VARSKLLSHVSAVPVKNAKTGFCCHGHYIKDAGYTLTICRLWINYKCSGTVQTNKHHIHILQSSNFDSKIQCTYHPFI